MGKPPPFRAFALLACAASISIGFPARPAASGEPPLTRDEQESLATASAFSKAFATVAKIIRPAVVNIQVERKVVGRSYNNPYELFNDLLRNPGMPIRPRPSLETGQGTGVIIDGKGYILTNNHVVGEADAIRVTLLDGRVVPAELVGSDESTDVAVIRIEADNLTVARLGDSDGINVGEFVIAVGNPFGFDFTVTSGIISASGRSGMGFNEIEDFIQTDAAINPGNSGGPLVNLRGEVIGINTGIFSRSGGYQGIGFAIPINLAKSIMQSLIAHQRVTTSYLGVETQPLRPEVAQSFGLPSARGALIRSVAKGSPGDKAGLRRGAIVLRWGRREITSDQQLRNLVTLSAPGETVELEVFRNGANVLLKVTLIASPEEVVVEGKGDRIMQGLGISVSDFTPALRDRLSYEPGAEGVVVSGVEPGSPGARLGMRAGSLIMRVDGKDVATVQDLRAALGATGARLEFDIVWRTGPYVNRARIKGR